MTTMQNFIWSSSEAMVVPEMYFRLSNPVSVPNKAEAVLNLRAGSDCSFDTYFNAFSVSPWQTKCQIDNLFFAIRGKGQVTISVFHRTLCETTLLAETSSDLVFGSPQRVEIPQWTNLTEGLIYVRLQANTDVSIEAASFDTDSTPTKPVKLGIVVTHFKRKAYVLPAIKRISETLLSNCDISDGLELIVVDNSRDIEAHEAGKATLIPNQNLGGSGGFTRGLLHLKDHDFTHCLFMDDDASCELESIYRTYRLLQFAKDERLAVAGAMILEENLYQTHAIGGRIRRGIGTARAHGLDLRTPSAILQIAYLSDQIHYGAWWHFAFNIASVHKFPFPFFVKGDDQLFSIANDFDIISLNGVAVWAMSFASKNSPTSKYLATRATLLGQLFLGNSPNQLRKYFHESARKCLFAYDYAGARALILGAQHFMKGPVFWTDNMDMSNVFPMLVSISASHQLREISSNELAEAVDIPTTSARNKRKENGRRRALRNITLNGHLLPRFMLSSSATVVRGRFDTDPKDIFGHHAGIHIVKEPNLGFKLPMNKLLFWQLYLHSIYISFKLAFKMKGLRREYVRAMPDIMTEDFWRKVYNMPKPKVDR